MPPRVETRIRGPSALGVHEDRGVQLARDRKAALDEKALDRVPADGRAEQSLGRRTRGFGALRHPDAARLAAPAGRDLRLDHAGAEPCGDPGRRFGAGRHLALGQLDAGRAEQGFPEVLLEVHRP
jgi:hypothetical protein